MHEKQIEVIKETPESKVNKSCGEVLEKVCEVGKQKRKLLSMMQNMFIISTVSSETDLPRVLPASGLNLCWYKNSG
jgi:hypothetical protein